MGGRKSKPYVLVDWIDVVLLEYYHSLQGHRDRNRRVLDSNVHRPFELSQPTLRVNCPIWYGD